MKRKDLMKRVEKIAKDAAAAVTTKEGGAHTKVMLDGKFVTTVPRHKEINELTAKAILQAVEQAVKGDGRDAV